MGLASDCLGRRWVVGYIQDCQRGNGVKFKLQKTKIAKIRNELWVCIQEGNDEVMGCGLIFSLAWWGRVVGLPSRLQFG